MQQEHDKNRLTRRDAHRGTVKVAPATHEPPLARLRERSGGEGNGHGFHYPECLTKP
jgi:hypothetical protein